MDKYRLKKRIVAILTAVGFVISGCWYMSNSDRLLAKPEEKTIQNDKPLIININTASCEDLKQLSGVGDSLAQAIIEYRNSNGPFEDINEIKRVKGIGVKKFNKISKYIKI